MGIMRVHQRRSLKIKEKNERKKTTLEQTSPE
jgi:hypothetical protein